MYSGKLMKPTNYSDLRTDYGKNRIDDSAFPQEPFVWFENWLSEAVDSGLPDANAMMLSTVSLNGKPSSRVVLLKEFSRDGLVFFTNYESRKGAEIEINSNVALLFFWSSLERQIRVEGKAVKLTGSKSDEYFYSRPFQSRAAAVVSQQSKVIQGRKNLDEDFEKLISENNEIFRPDNWGGYIVIPSAFEFWQGRPNRLHDRIRFIIAQENWIVERLAP